jgi:beta-lactam-binding protein with PASTA domain
MPKLEGLPYAEAELKMRELGFSLGINQQLYHDDVPEGIVLRQNYYEGTPLDKEGDYTGELAIEVNVSLGPELFAVPDLTGVDIEQAKLIFTESSYESGFTLNIENVPDENTPVGVVIRQEPEPDSRVSAGCVMVVYVSGGKEIQNINMPKLTGLSEGDAREKIIKFGLTIGRTTFSDSDRYARGIVMSQSVNSGVEIPQETIVDLVVSRGAAGVSPDPDPRANEPAPSAEPEEPSPNDEDDEPTSEEPANGEPEATEEPAAPASESAAAQTEVPSATNKIVEINIGPDTFLDAEASVDVKIYKRSGGDLILKHEGEYGAADFPISPVLTGTGIEEIVVYFNGGEVGSQAVEFGE